MNDAILNEANSRVNQWSTRIRPFLIIPCGAVGGLTLGIVARAWMRWISTEPEFSWAGTIFIVCGFTVFFTAHATVLFGIRKVWSRSWLTVTRVGAIIFSLGIFGAAGASMLPAVVALSLATGRTDWRRPIRIVLFMLGLIIPGFIARDIGSDFGYGIATAGRIILFVFIYFFVVAAARITAAPLADSWRMKRVLRIILWSLVAVIGIVLFLASVGLSG